MSESDDSLLQKAMKVLEAECCEYRILAPHELVREGDEVCYAEQEWVLSGNWTQRVPKQTEGLKYRRKEVGGNHER